MTYERFLKITLGLRAQDEKISKVYDMKVDLLDFVDPYHAAITELIKEVYGDTGYDWWSWFCYENDYGEKGHGAWDENKNPICYSFESLWEYLEKIKQEKTFHNKYEIRFKDIDPDTGEVSQDKTICFCESKGMLETVMKSLDLALQQESDPNREIYSVELKSS